MTDGPHVPAASGQIYHSARLAEAYAYSRPPVHPQVVRRISDRLFLGPGRRVVRALDVGCGAGLSTAALHAIAERVVGIDPVAAMLAHHEVVAPAGLFGVARAEALPFQDRAFDLVTAAGALNYAARGSALAEIARVLAPAATLVIYDFSAGRRARSRRAAVPENPGSDAANGHAGREAADLDHWFSRFARRYPFPPGYAMDAATLDYAAFGLRLAAYDVFEIVLPIDFDAYVRYVLSETNVEHALADGASSGEIASWCRTTLRPLFGNGPLDVCFDGYAAYVSRARPEENT